MSSLRTWSFLRNAYLTNLKTEKKNVFAALYSSIKRYKPQFRVAYIPYDTLGAKRRPSLPPSKKFIKKLDLNI